MTCQPVQRACSACQLVQLVPPKPPKSCVRCVRCRHVFSQATDHPWRNPLAAACAFAALILYPAAVTLPVMRLSQLGHVHETGIFAGAWTLLTKGHAALGIIVLACSVVIPAAKICSILALTAFSRWFSAHHVRFTHQMLQLTGRWGMLDVLLVAVLVAAVRLGDLVDVTAGPGAGLFAAVVALSMVASTAFDPRSIWKCRSSRM